MPGSKIRILQVGDVHFPEAQMEAKALDVKDVGFPGALAVRTAASPFQTVMRQIQMLLEKKECEAIAFMGDLSTRGDKSAYENCINYLAEATWDNPSINFNRRNVLISPGNHDVNRKDATNPNFDFKFEYINQHLNRFGLQKTLVDGIQKIDVDKDLAHISIVGINTAVGCGVVRGLPDRILSTVRELYDQEISTTADPKKIAEISNELYEILDTPLITEITIQKTVEHIVSKNHPVIVVGHHNLLPQYTPRIAPYTELLNSGLLRSRLLSTQKKVVYLHGHIHDDPIEVISSPLSPSSLLVAVSAPEVSRGYNILEFEFDARGQALGCEVRCFRYKDGGIALQRVAPVPLASALEVGASADEARLIDAVNDKRALYWHEAKNATGLADDELEDAIVRMMWQKRIFVDRPDPQRDRWLIRRCY